jgi:hypothetical protein
VTMNMRLGAKNKYDNSWKQIAKSTEQREHNCKEVHVIVGESSIWLGKLERMLLTCFLVRGS